MRRRRHSDRRGRWRRSRRAAADVAGEVVGEAVWQVALRVVAYPFRLLGRGLSNLDL